VDAIVAQDCGGIVLAGGAGVGKTRLASEVVRAAAGQRCATEWVAATRAGASIPFGSFAHLLPDFVLSTVDQLGVLRRIVDALIARANGRRLVVAIDDAHLLDDASATLVHQLAGTRNAFILATLRAGVPAPDPIVALWKDGMAERLELQALSEGQVHELAVQVLGGHVDGAMSYTAFAINNKGKVRALAVAMEKRHPLLPDTPTFRELGVDWVDGAYRGIGVPKSTPAEVRKRLSDLWASLNDDPEMKELAAKSGFELVNVGSEQMDAFMKQKIKIYTEGAKLLNLGK